MQEKRLNKVYTIDISDKVAISFGTINKKNPVVVYLSLGTWIYTNATGNNKEKLISLEDTIRKSIKTNLLFDGLFCERYLLTYDVCLDNVFRRKRFLAAEIFLKQNGTTINSVKELLPTISERTSNLVDELIDDIESNGFTVSKTKK